MAILTKYYLNLRGFYPVKKKIRKLAKQGYSQSLKDERFMSKDEDYPIDFVVTWVDGNDPEWLTQKQKFMPDDSLCKSNNASARYRDWDNLQYWFRAVEKYAPWVRYIYFVTYGHLPRWLDTENPKLKIIKHTDFIPDDFLPTFSCRPIEFNLWRIPGLSEQFVYFNDDVFLTNPVEKHDFFHNGEPILLAVSKPNVGTPDMSSWMHARFNNCWLCNTMADVRSVMEAHPEKWFSHRYVTQIRYNIRSYEDGYFSGMVFPHSYLSLRRSSMKDFSERYKQEFNFTCSHRFRTNEDLNIQIFSLWDMLNNTFYPAKYDSFGKYLDICKTNIKEIENAMFSASINGVCLNDTAKVTDDGFSEIQNQVNNILKKKYSQKSSFEKQI